MTPTRSVRFGVVVSSVVLLAALCSGVSTGSAFAASGDAAAEVQQMLDKRVAALQTGDREAYMSYVDPKAPDTFRATQSTSYDGLRSLPLNELAFTVRTTESGDLAHGLKLAEYYKSGDAFLPETRVSYKLGAYDDAPALTSRWDTYVERDGKWYVAGDDDAAVLGLGKTQEIWDFGEVPYLVTQHFIVLWGAGVTRTPELTARANGVASMAEEAMAVFTSRWTQPWSGKIPIVIASTPEQASALLRTTLDVNKFVAFVAYTPIRDGDTWSVTAPRMYAQDQNLATQSRSQQIGDLVHELTHAATAQMSGPFTPVWLHEGLAEWVRLGKSTSVSSVRSNLGSLPNNADFASANPATLGGAYASANAAVTYLASTRGVDAPVNAMKEIGARRVVAGSPAYNADVAFRSSVGVGLSDFEAALADK